MLAWALLLFTVAAPEEPREQAWLAHRAGRDDVPLLRQLLAQHAESKTEESRLVREQVFDRLIQLKARVPWKELAPAFTRESTGILLLLAQHPKANQETLLAVMDDTLGERHWRLVCNLLVRQRTPGFAARLLAGLELKLKIRVVDKGAGFGGRGGSRGMGFGDGRLKGKPGWPPRVRYSLNDRGPHLIAPGRKPVYYERIEVKAGGVRGFGGSSGWADRNRERIRYIGDLLGMKEAHVGLRTRSFATIVWQNEADYLKDAWRAHERIYSAFDAVLESLIDLELMTKKEAARLSAEIETSVEDARKDKRPPLPELPG